MPAPSQPAMRKFGDYDAVRDNVYAGALSAVQNLPPVENSRYRLQFSDLGYAGAAVPTIAEHKQAMLEGRSLSRRLTGVVTLTDKASGTPVDSRRMTIASVPALTPQGVFVVDGHASPVSHQLRLLPGVYARRKGNGFLESHVNLLPGTGVPHRVMLDPETGVFKTTVGQAEIPTISLLKILGATPDELKAAWGPELYQRNEKADKPHHVDRYWEKMGPPGPVPDGTNKAKTLAERLTKYPLDPWVSRRTLGRNYDRYGKDPLLATTAKLLHIARGKVEPDDRDDPSFSTVWGPEHLVAERLSRSGPLLSKLMWQATNAGHLRKVQPGFLTPSIRALFLKSGLALVPEGTSAAEFVDHGARITKVGEGGLGKSADSVPFSARDVRAGQFPFIDLIRTSECFDDKTEVMTFNGWKPWPDVTAADELACVVDGTITFHRPERLHVYDHDGLMYGAKNAHIDYLVTPNHRFWTSLYVKRDRQLWRWRTAEQVHGRTELHRVAGFAPYAGDPDFREFKLPRVEAAVADLPDQSETASRRFVGVGRLHHRDTVPTEPFCELLGWYLGEGSFRDRRTSSGPQYAVLISQSQTANPQKCERIAAVLDELGITYTYQPSTRAFAFCGKQWVRYFGQFGKSPDRFIPEPFFRASAAGRRRLFDALLLAEGTVNRYGRVERFGTTSRRLAADFARLAFSLGFSTSTAVRPDNREERYLDLYEVTVHSRDTRIVAKPTKRPGGLRAGDHYTAHYTGKVYCATVPGGMLYVRRGDGSGMWTGNSESVGVDLRVAFGTRLGADNRIYAPLRDMKTGKLVFRSPQDLADKTLGFPAAITSREPVVPVVRGGKLTYAPREEVDYAVPSMEQSFSPLSNMVPLKSGGKAHRASMAGRMISQSLPLVGVEAPLVRAQVPGQPGRSFEELYGPHMGAVVARKDQPGTVTEVADGHVAVRYADGQTVKHERYNSLPSGRKTGYFTAPVVAAGDRVGPGQLLAKSNFTDDRGHAAYGKNLRVGFLNMRGKSYEDAIVVSESAAKKLRSDHLYRHDVYADPDVLLGRLAHTAAFPGKHPVEVLKTLDDSGVVKVGTTVKKGDPLVLAVRRRQNLFGRLSRSGKAGLSDASELWEHDEPGLVTDAVQTKNGPVVLVRTEKDLKTGDKLSGRYGNKGVSVIVPDHEMPVDAEGNPLEVVISSLGVISRANPNSKYEALLGKIAAKTGRPYVVNDWDDEGSGKHLGRWVRGELDRAGLRAKENLTDPQTGRTIPNVLTGVAYIMKLHHTSEGKVKGRGLGGYDESGQPLRGQSGKAMRASLGDTNALLSHGATNVIHDAHIFKGQENSDFWLAFMSGYPPTRPAASKPFERFLTELRGAGIDPVNRAGRYHLTALTDAKVRELAGDRVVANAETLDFSRNGEPVPGGLFDTATFGAADSTTRWAKIPLHEPVLNPVFEEPARRLLGLTEKQFRDVVAGRHDLAGRTGMAAVTDALGRLDVGAELAKARIEAAAGRKTARETANRKLFYLKGLDRTGQSPKDWILSAVPVLPPGLRPVSAGGPGGSLIVSDANLLYGDVMGANAALRDLSKEVDDVGAERLNLYDAVKAVVGLGDPVGAKNRERGVKGVLGRLLGDSAKHSFMQQKLLGTPVNLSGRGVVVPNPDLDLDQIGIPESMAKDVYHPFVVRRLVRGGMSRVDAAREVEGWGAKARQALTDEMDARPVLATRYPALHRYNVMAFRPVLMKGDAIQTNHLINKGYNLDHDGDDQNGLVLVLVDTVTRAAIIASNPDHFGPDYWDYRDMTARFRTCLPVAKDDGLYCMNLQDFPRGEQQGTKAHIDFYAVPPGVRVVAYDETTCKPVAAEVTQWSVHHDRQVEIVNLLSGRQIITDDDLRAVYGIDPETLEFGRWRPSEAVGKMVPRVDAFDDPAGTPVTRLILAQGSPDEFVLDLTRDAGYFFGMMAGNGWVTGDPARGGQSLVCLAATDPGMQEAFDLAMKTVFGHDRGVSVTQVRAAGDATGYGPSVRLTAANARVARLVKPLIGSGAANKHLPPFFAAGSREFRLGVLEGLLDTDGSVSVAAATTGKRNPQFKANYATSSLRLAQECQHLLRTLGILASISTTSTPDARPFWLVNISAPDLVTTDLRLRHSGKAKVWAEKPPVNQEGSIAIAQRSVPFPKTLISRIRKTFGHAFLTHQGLYTTLTTAHRTCRTGRAAAKRVIDVVGGNAKFAADPLWARFVTLVNDETTNWDTVVGVEVTGVVETGYDLTVPGFETFMNVDGVILSNTMTVSVPLSDEAVQEAYDKLLPSKNLYSPANYQPTVALPNMEMVQALHAASTGDAGNPPVEFPTRKDAIAAYLRGEITYDTRVRVRGED